MGIARSMGQRLFWSLTWGVGVALGVAAGGWLTIAGSGVVGLDSPDLMNDLVVLPLIVGSLVALAYFLGSFVVGLFRKARPSDAHGDDDERE